MTIQTVYKVVKNQEGTLRSAVVKGELIKEYHPGVWEKSDTPMMCFDDLQLARNFARSNSYSSLFLNTPLEKNWNLEVWTGRAEDTFSVRAVLQNPTKVGAVNIFWKNYFEKEYRSLYNLLNDLNAFSHHVEYGYMLACPSYMGSVGTYRLKLIEKTTY